MQHTTVTNRGNTKETSFSTLIEEVMTKFVIIILLLAMMASLAVGLKQLLKTPDETDNRDKFANALKWRIGIWVFLFVFILLSMKMGWIKPSNSPNPVNFNKEQQQRIDAEKNN